MKYYDYAAVKAYIDEHKDEIDRACLGMQEDWGWTNDIIFADGEYLASIWTEPEICGIRYSTWATPVLQVNFKDGTQKILDAYKTYDAIATLTETTAERDTKPFLYFGL